ncbi:MAG: hypothetical protein ABSE73_17685, partial [Planctomycetota bacterium]
MKRVAESRTSWAGLSSSLAALGLLVLCGALAAEQPTEKAAPAAKPDKAPDKVAAAGKPAQAQPETIGDR